MQYDLDIESISPIRRRLHFKVGGDTVGAELDRAFNDLKKRVRLPGFRPGKVPRKLLEARFGKQVRGDVTSRLVDLAWRQAAPDLEVAGRPALEDSGELGGNTFEFTIGVDVRPEVQVDGYEGIEVPFKAAEISDEIVDARVQSRLSRESRLQEITDRAVAKGDEVLTQLKLTRTGDDGEEEVLAEEFGTKILTAGDRYYPGIEEHLVGLDVGAEHTAEVAIGDNSEFEHLRGQTAAATLKVMGIQARSTPELSDETAEELGYEGGVDGMKTAIRLELQTQADEAARQTARVKLLEKLVDANTIDVPEALVAEQFEALQEEMKVRRSYAGEDPRSIRFSDAELADLRRRGLFAARAALLLEAIAKQESIDVSDDDIDAKINEIAGTRAQAPEAIRGYLQREGAMPVLKTRISEEKTLEWLLEQATFVEPSDEAPAEPEITQQAAPAEQAAPAQAAPAEQAAPAQATPAQATPAQDAPATVEWKKSWKKAQLLEAAQSVGLDVNTKNTKAQIIEALESYTG